MEEQDIHYSRSIQDAIDESMSTLYEWQGQLKVECIHHSLDVADHDIMCCTHSHLGLIPANTYFPISKFPIESGYDGDGFKNLKKYLEIQSVKNGFNIFCNGGKNVSPLSTVKHYRMFKCTHARLYTNDIISRQSQEYRKVSYSYDRRNNRSQGKSMPRRSNTCRPCHS